MRRIICLSILLLVGVNLFAQDKKTYVGFGLGYTTENYFLISGGVTYKSVYMGMGVGLPTNKGTKGECYEVINWNEFPEDFVKEGEYSTPFTFDFGYSIVGLTVGGGIGCAFDVVYQNCYDKTHILGRDGYYYKIASRSSAVEYKGFVKYQFPSKSYNPSCRFYISAQYTRRTGYGFILGLEI